MLKPIAVAVALALSACAACTDDLAEPLEHPGGIMPAYTFTANAGTDEITTSSPHGLATGDGPATVRNVGGALPTAAPALVALTDYWVIVTGASTLKLATSSANALANTPIDITGTGTGTHYFEIGIPYRRPRTYGVGSQLKSADLNDNFDAWKALYALLTAQTQSIWSGIALAANQDFTVSGTGRFKHGDMIRHVSPIVGNGAGWSWDSANGYLASSGAGTWYIGIPTSPGETIKSITFERYGDGAADLTGDIFKRAKAAAVGASLFSISVTNAAASYVDEVCDFADQAIVDGDSMWITLTASAANLRVGEIRVTYSRP